MVDRDDQFNPNLASVGSTWAKAGCFEDSKTSPPFNGAMEGYYDEKNLTVTQCTTLCGKSNKKVAAMMKRGSTIGWVSLRIEGIADESLSKDLGRLSYANVPTRSLRLRLWLRIPVT